MILAKDFGYTLQCSGCTATISLNRTQLADPYRSQEIRSNMRKAHSQCDAFKDVVKAKHAIKAARRAARRALLSEVGTSDDSQAGSAVAL